MGYFQELYEKVERLAMAERDDGSASPLDGEEPAAGIGGPRLVRLADVAPEAVRWL